MSLRLLRDHLAVLPKIDGGSVHARDFARCLGGDAQAATHARGKALRVFRLSTFSGHGLRSSNFRDTPELSYIVQ